METTTIKIHLTTKRALDALGALYKSYDEVIYGLISEVKKKNLIRELKLAYLAKAKEDSEIAEEWDSISQEMGEVWK